MTVKQFIRFPDYTNQVGENRSALKLAESIAELIHAAENKVGNSAELMEMVKSSIKRLQELPLPVQFVIVELFLKIIEGIHGPSEISSFAATQATGVNGNPKPANDDKFQRPSEIRGFAATQATGVNGNQKPANDDQFQLSA